MPAEAGSEGAPAAKLGGAPGRWAALRAGVLARLHNRRFWRDSGLLMLANIIVTGLALVRTPAMTWLVPKDEVGMLAVMAAWLPFVQLLSLPGMDAASYHYIATGHRWAFAVNLASRLRWSLLSAAAFGLGAWYWWSLGEPALGWLFVVAAVTYPVTIGLTAAGGTLAAREQFTHLFWYRLGESLTDFAGFIPLLAGVWWVARGVTFYAANQLATAAMMAALSWWLLRTLAGAEPEPAARAAMVRFGRHQTAISSISVVQARSDALLVAFFFPLGVMADFSIGQIVANQFRTLWGIYINVRYPPLARMAVARRRRRMALEGGVIFMGFVALGFAVYALGAWLIPLILPPEYQSSIPFIGWLTAVTLAGTPGGIAEVYFRTVEKQRPQYQMRLVGMVAGLALPAALLIPWGLAGLLGGRLAANILFSIYGIHLAWVDGGRGSGEHISTPAGGA